MSTETKGKEWREFWATQDPDDMDGVYIMSEDQSYVEDHEKVETKFKVIEYAALEALQKENERFKEKLKNAKITLSNGRKLMITDNEYIKKLEKENAELRAELEKERMRLAACGVVALANTKESAKKFRDMHEDYWCASVKDVANAVDREMALREENEKYRAAHPELSKVDHLTFGDLMIQRGNLRQTLEKCVKALQGKADDWDVLVQAQELLNDKPQAAEKEQGK